MHQIFNYPINCFGSGAIYKSVDIQLINGEKCIVPGELNGVYDPFSVVDLIPSLVTVVEKVHTTGNKEKHIAKWVAANGLLSEPDSYQTVSSFWGEAQKLHDMWKLYKCITNRDLEGLKCVSNVIQVENKEYEHIRTHSHRYTFFNDEHLEIDILGFSRSKSYLRDYQNAAIHYLVEVIKPYINNGELTDLEIARKETFLEDLYKVTPGMFFPNLLDALYMQFFIFLSENTKKVCSVCNTPYTPSRQDKKYCSKSCYNTGKSQRQRERQYKAYQMFQSGYSVEQIAESLSRNEELIQKWINQQKNTAI